MLSNQYSPSSPTLQTGNQLRQPRGIVLINGISVLWVDIQVTTTTFYVADSYNILIPLTGQPQGFDLKYLSLQSQFVVEIYIGFPQNPNSFTTQDLKQILIGEVDMMDIDPLARTVRFSGRDLTSRLIDTKTYAKYPNQTASLIATQLAQKHDLTPVVTNTTQKVGTFYNNENTLMTRETTEWDLLTFLAQQSGFVTYVEGYNLFFRPSLNAQDSTPFILSYQQSNLENGSPIFNGMELSFTRALTLTKDVTVRVRVPHSPKTGKAFTVSAGKKNPTINSSSSGNQIYTFTYPGLTKAQAQDKARQILENITINEIRLNATIPGNNELSKTSVIKVVGTGTRFDQIYYTDNIHRRLNYSEGYTMDIDAKNIDTNSQVTL